MFLQRVLVTAMGLCAVVSVQSASVRTVDVASTAELVTALALEPAPIEIRLRQGEYLLHEPLVVPDGVSLRGTGIMLVDESGLPSGFERGTETTLRVAAAFQGDVVRLGNGSGLYGLRVVDRRDDPADLCGAPETSSPSSHVPPAMWWPQPFATVSS